MDRVRIEITQSFTNPEQFVASVAEETKDTLTVDDVLETCIRALKGAGYYPPELEDLLGDVTENELTLQEVLDKLEKVC